MKTFYYLLFFLAFCSCTMNHPDLDSRTSFVISYFEFDEIKSNQYVVSIDSVDYLLIDLYIPKAHMLACIYDTDKQRSALYKSYCQKHNDFSKVDLNKRLTDLPDNPSHICYPASDFVDVSITSNTIWDETHAADSPLDDISYFVAVSPRKMIENGYLCFDYTKFSQSSFFNNVFGLFAQMAEDYMYYPIDMPVDELEANDLSLLGFGQMSQPGGWGFEEPDMFYYWPEVIEFYGNYFPEVAESYGDSLREDELGNFCSIFIPFEKSDFERSLTVTLKDEDGIDYSTIVTVAPCTNQTVG